MSGEDRYGRVDARTAGPGGDDAAAPAVVTLGRIIRPLFFRRRLLAWSIIVGLAAGTLHFLVSPRQYDSTASILPESQPLLPTWQGVGQLASLAGVSLPVGGDATLVYPDILRSNSLLTSVLAESTAADGAMTIGAALGFGADQRDVARGVRYLRRRVVAWRDQKSGIVHLRVRLRDRMLVQTVAGRLLAGLDEYYRHSHAANAAANRDFLDREVAKAGAELAAAEDALAAFRMRNRRIADSPALRSEEQRLARELVIRDGLFVELNEQRELAAVAARRDVPVIRILDEPDYPTRRAHPRPFVSLLLGGSLMLAVAVFGVYVDAYLRPLVRREIGGSPRRPEP